MMAHKNLSIIGSKTRNTDTRKCQHHLWSSFWCLQIAISLEYKQLNTFRHNVENGKNIL